MLTNRVVVGPSGVVVLQPLRVAAITTTVAAAQGSGPRASLGGVAGGGAHYDLVAYPGAGATGQAT